MELPHNHTPLFYSTLDLDKVDNDHLEMVINKLCHCPKNQMHTFSWLDTQKGYHVIFSCLKECNDCRLVFDDPIRWDIDFKRPNCLQNVLFEPFSAHKVKA